MYFFFFKQKTAYELRISDWSSDVCSSDLVSRRPPLLKIACGMGSSLSREYLTRALQAAGITALFLKSLISWRSVPTLPPHRSALPTTSFARIIQLMLVSRTLAVRRSEENTSELQSLMRTSYAVFCLKKTNTNSTI